ncbi:transglutaminase-like domain-containing protein [Ruthenibacterium lactatiformans]|uniref:transglutaminase-like domain-containing protein n=1 Tax=Ruthenibacterium lactatiformans TaxID=1550024 RepID=UPI00210A5931|nr:transglutaminase-like domain-containing protein [Ruthenibacterium lactatiformans]
MKRQWRGGMAAFLTFIMLISGCSAAPAGSGAESRTMAPADGTHYEPPAFRSAEFHPDAAVSGSGVEIDLSAVSQGYVAVRAQSDKRLKCQVVYGDIKYNYDLPGDGTPVVYPLQSGNGQYNVRVMQNTTENKYMELFSAQADVVLDSEFEPFLRPSQRVVYSVDSACVLLASDISAQAADAAAVVSSVYEYIQSNVDYDYDKAQNIVDNNVTGYLPDPDETLSTKKGICYDYAALAAAMLRSQGIPTKLITGYVSSGGSELYHAWNMIWLEESGWITVEIRAPRHEWQRIDLTFAAAGQSALVGDGKGYADKEVY